MGQKNYTMEKTFEKVEELAGDLKEYVNTRIESVKFTAAEKISRMVAKVVAVAVVVVVFLFFIGFASIGLAIVLGEWIGNPWAGFLVVGGLYLLIGIIVFFARGSLIGLPVMNAVIQQIFKNDDEED